MYTGVLFRKSLLLNAVIILLLIGSCTAKQISKADTQTINNL